MAEPVPIYGHVSDGRGYYYDLKVPGKSGWGDGERAFYAYDIPQDGTLPIYHHQYISSDLHYYDTRPTNDHKWTRGGEVGFHAYPSPHDGTVPVYSHHKDTPRRYYYGTQKENKFGWSDGEVAFYAFPPNTTLIDDIAGVLGGKGVRYKGSTYQVTDDNRFTLLDTPRLWGKGPKVTQPSAACKEFLIQLESTVAIAHNIVDIAVLWNAGFGVRGLPDGEFQQALSQALWSLSQSDRRPLVRIIVGIPGAGALASLGILAAGGLPATLGPWLSTTVQLNNRQRLSEVPYPIMMAMTSAPLAWTSASTSWNHAKIVAVDGVRVIAGGHNMWAGDYLGDTPVHDVSGLIEGSAAACAHRFCDHLWTRPYGNPTLLKDGKLQIQRGTSPSRRTGPGAMPNNGTTRVLSLGRLGDGIVEDFTIATNASVSARIMAICRAKSIIRISQQSLYFTVAGQGGFDLYTLWALVKAMEENVRVQIVVSNKAGGGYDGRAQLVMDSLATLYVASRSKCFAPDPNPLSREDLNGWAQAALEASAHELPLLVDREPRENEYKPYIREVNAKLSVAPLYYAPNVNYWQVGGTQEKAINHAKVYIIDDTHFYVGSDNVYLSGNAKGLQEYGHLIEGKPETQKFIADYWEPLWRNSGPHTVSASAPRLYAYPLRRSRATV